MSGTDLNRFTETCQSTEPPVIADLVSGLRRAIPDIDVEAFNVVARPLDMDECSRAGVPDGYWMNQWKIYIGHHPEHPADPWVVIEETVSTIWLDEEAAPLGEVMGYEVLRNDKPAQSEAIFPCEAPQEEIIRTVADALKPKEAEQS